MPTAVEMQKWIHVRYYNSMGTVPRPFSNLYLNLEPTYACIIHFKIADLALEKFDLQLGLDHLGRQKNPQDTVLPYITYTFAYTINSTST